MKNIVFLLVLFSILSCSNKIEGDIIITNINIIDVESGTVKPNHDIVIIGDSIAQINKSIPKNSFLSSQIIDGSNKYVIPGLWDMHTHTNEHNIPILTSYGITGFRDMAGGLKQRDSMRQLDKFKGLPIPRMEVSGYILGGDPGRDGAKTATMEEARYFVDLLAEAGVDQIKTYYYLHPEVYLAIIDQAKKYGLTVQGHVPMAFGIEQASKLGQKSIEHMSAVPYWCTPNSQKISKTIMSTWYDGQEGPSYSNELLDQVIAELDSTVINKLAQTLKLNNTYLCPTMSTYEYLTNITDSEYSESPHLELMNYQEKYNFKDDLRWSKEIYMKDPVRGYEYLAKRKKILKQLFDKGTPIIAGTDAGVAFQGIHLHKELEIYVELGLTPLQALQTATINPARFLNLENKLGSIKEGKWADLLLLDKNPIENIKNTRSIYGVIAQGKYASRNDINRVLDSIRIQFSKKPIIDTVKTIMAQKGLDSALKVTRQLKREKNENFIFDGEQFVLFAREIWSEERLDEVEKLLKMEIELNPDKQWYSLVQLGSLYRSSGQTKKARQIYKRLINLFGPTELRAQSHLRRLDNPDYGKQVFQEIPNSLNEELSNTFIDQNEVEYKITTSHNKIILEKGQKTDTLYYVGNGVFRKKENYHDRLIIWENNSLLKLDFDLIITLKKK